MTTNLIHLSDRGLLAITGPDAAPFLQGMVTCNIDHLSPEKALYGAHLTSQGRLIAPFFVYLINGKVTLDCAKDQLMPLAKTLHGYQMRFDIEFEDLTDELAIYADLTPETAEAGTCTATEAGLKVIDPRTPLMGTRHILPAGTKAEGTLAAYHQKRIELAVPEQADFTPNKTIAGEFCLEYQNGVDYKKGCYIGQEMTARTHFRNPPKKRVIAITYKSTPPPYGADLLAGKLKVGTVFSCADGHGIAIARVEKALAEGATLTAEGAEVFAQKPKWANYDIESK